MTHKRILFLFFISFQTLAFSQLDSGRYEGKSAELFLHANNYFKVTGLSGDFNFVYKGNYYFKGDTLILNEKISPTRISYYLIRSDSIVWLKHNVIANGKIIDQYYKNYVFKDSLETKTIGLANYSFSRMTMPWGFSFNFDPTLEKYNKYKIISCSFKPSKKLSSQTIEKILSSTKIDKGTVFLSKTLFAHIFQSVYYIDGFQLKDITLTKHDDKNLIAVITYDKVGRKNSH